MIHAPAPEAPPDPTALPDLFTLIEACFRSGVPRSVLLLSARRMPPHLNRPHHLRLAQEALEPLTFADRAHSFDLPDGSRALTWRGDAGALLDRALGSLGHLLDGEAGSEDLTQLARTYALPRETDELRTALQEVATTGIPIQAAFAAPLSGKREKLDPITLHGLEQALTQVDVSRFARRRRLWREALHRQLEPAWEKRFLAVHELVDSLMPGHDATADPWLYRRLTRTLDRRLLSLLTAPDELRDCGPFSLELNVGTILAPEFLRFDAALPHRLRGHLVIDLLPADILADPAGYLFARGFLRARRYRVMIREVTAPLLKALDFTALDPDYIELVFTPADQPELAAALTQTPPQGPELALTYTTPPAARAFAQTHAINLLAPR